MPYNLSSSSVLGMKRSAPKKRKVPARASDLTDQPKEDPHDAAATGDTETQQAKFERELAWCIEQLQLGSNSAKSKRCTVPDEAAKVLKVLRNPSCAMVRKRQLMSASFGDYRKKMDEELKRYKTSAKAMSMKAVPRDSLQKSTYFRKASLRDDQPLASTSASLPRMQEDSACAPCSTSSLAEAPSAAAPYECKPSGSAFQFNFSIDDETGEEEGDSTVAGTCEHSASRTAPSDWRGCASSTAGSTTAEPALNYYKIETTDNAFRFSFSPDAT